jgi:hypothetical protein
MDAYLRSRADQPLGDTDLVSGRTLSPFSRAGMQAADNLLIKAERALASGDLERASHFVGRAVALPYDEHEKTAPAAFAVEMMLFTAVTDALEDSPEGDSDWLDAAVEALSGAKGWGRSELRNTLLTARKDYVVERAESRRIDIAVADVPERVELSEAALPAEELTEAVMSVLHTLRAYRSALAMLGRPDDM